MTLPLHALRVLDLSEGPAESCGRFLADLGAEVLRVEPPGGSPGRSDAVGFALRNANKRGLTLDLADESGRAALLSRVRHVDVLLESFGAAEAASLGLTPAGLLAANPALVVVSVTDFGRTGPWADRVATEDVLAAAGGVLSRSGLPGGTPLLPPAGLVGQTVGVHAAWAALVAYVKRVRTGVGEHVDVSAFEAVVHGFDPGFGAQGSAAAGRSESFPRDRPDAANFYPVFPCADGDVRICLLAKRQWRAMFEWLGEPEEFADPRYDAIPARFDAADRLNPLITALFAGRTREELTLEGSRRGVPVGGMLTVAEVLEAEHLRSTGTLVTAEIADGLRATVPTGYVSIDGERAGLRVRAPRPGEHDDLPVAVERDAPDLGLARQEPGERPLAGLRVLDLGVIVFGAELGRAFADQGAEVIKIENSAFPDGLRQTRRGGGMNASFAWGGRNKRGLGLDLRSDQGRALFRRLVGEADLVVANFKPGTLESLGFSHADLVEINPRIVVSDSSAFGSHGPWRTRMGYGPLVRASCGVSALWQDPATDDFCDGSTVYPDHVAGQVAAVAALAVLIGRGADGPGRSIEIAQADTAIVALGPTLARASLDSASVGPEGNRRAGVAPAGVFPCAGEDEWCVVVARDDADWERLAEVTGLPADEGLRTLEGRLERRGELEKRLGEWTAERGPDEVADLLQAAGVPAAGMLRLPDELTHPQLVDRDSFHEMAHPLLKRPIPAMARAARFSSIPDSPLEPAPMAGEHTREIARVQWALTDGEIEGLVRSAVLQPPTGE
ncbi:CoA transferase [Pseudonocardia xishanensis]|uniref:CoA transferase n=1 Tax=Pseudonocardia xishanensis TaxID=630995 RepID=A0ABP8RTK5_9PSEU